MAYFDGEKWHPKSIPGLSWGIDYRSVCEAKDGSLWFGAAANAIAEKGQHGGALRYDPAIGSFDDERLPGKSSISQRRGAAPMASVRRATA